MMTASPRETPNEVADDDGGDAREGASSTPALPLSRLVCLLTSDTELDARWGARRQGERIPFCKPLSLSRIELVEGEVSDVDVEATFDGWALNICHGGLRVITEQALRAGDFLGVEVSSSGTVYAGKARVAWVRQEPDGVVAGLQFTFFG